MMKGRGTPRDKGYGNGTKPNLQPSADPDLRRRAEARMTKLRRERSAADGRSKSSADTQRLLHELQVHQIELEMQNADLEDSRNRAEILLAKYSDLYDFAPVGYVSLDARGRILEANLTASTLLGVERIRLMARPLSRFVGRSFRPLVLDFLGRLVAGAGRQVFEAQFQKDDGTPFWASLHGGSAMSAGDPKTLCRVAISDITSFKEAQESQRRAEILSVSNAELKKEIARRRAVEAALKKNEQRQRRLLKQVRSLSHHMMQTREEERVRISRELHDEIAQTLVGINAHLEALARSDAIAPGMLRKKIAWTQRLVEKSVKAVLLFARTLRPTTLDDLGLEVALHALFVDFTKQTGIRVDFPSSAGVAQLKSDRSTTLYRVVQSALANVAEHSHASRVTVNLRTIANAVHLEIADNGKSFDPERMQRAGEDKHVGLIGMRERVKMMGGRFAIKPVPGKGTTLHVWIPTGGRARRISRP